MSETAELKKRLEALEDGTGVSKARRPSLMVALLGAGGIVALGGVLLLFTGEKTEEPLQTGTPEEFQTTGSGFGRIEPAAPPPVQTRAPDPEPAPPAEDPQAAALLARLDEMQAELAALRAAPVERAEPDPDALTALQEQIAAMRADADAAQAALEAELEERAREIQRLQTDLELARLEQPAIPTNTGPTAEELRLQELERRRQEERAAYQARVESPIIAFGGSSGASPESEAEERRLDSGTDFVRNGAAAAEVTQAQVIVNPSNTVVQGTMIQAVLETAVDSSLPGQVRAMVSEDVHAFDGSRVLIPRGARLVGRYQSGVDIAQQRITVAWDRIILPDNQTVEISAFGGDELGRSGTTGFVDSRFGTRFGSAALISLIGVLPGLAGAQTENETTSDALESVGEDLQDSAQSVIGEYLSISPIIYVDQGARITVMVDRDLEIF